LSQAKGRRLPEVSLSTMWAKGRFSHMAGFAAKVREFGFTHVEPNALVSPIMLNELLKTAVPISSIHSPCPAVLSSKGSPVSSLSLSSLDMSERTEAVGFTKKTIDLSLQERLYKLHDGGYAQTEEYRETKERLVHQRFSLAPPYVDAARKSLQELSKYSRQKGIMLGLETRFHFNEIPDMDEMAGLLDELSERLAGYWHDVGHAEVQQQLGFSFHEEWLSRFKDRMVGIHLHDICDISDHHAPGNGNMNWEMIAKHLPQGIVRVCEIGEWNDEEQMQGVIKFLQKKGILD
jgi:sugar phosphate isomerase/epimerase